MEKQRLDKLLASTGLWSRREAKALIRQGLVSVEGRAACSPEEKADPEAVAVEGRPLPYRRYTWLMMNKPAGVLSATEDGRGRTVVDLLSPELRRRNLFPVGRLDKDSTGLLLLTNEGRLAHDLLSPRRHVDKAYRVTAQGPLGEADRAAFAQGITLPDGTAFQSAGLEVLSSGPVSQALVTLREGKYHQIKRMMAHRGAPVLELERIRMGNLTLDPALSPGNYRFLTDLELEGLRRF